MKGHVWVKNVSTGGMCMKGGRKRISPFNAWRVAEGGSDDGTSRWGDDGVTDDASTYLEMFRVRS